MLVNLRLLFGLLWQPISATQRLRERAPVAFAVFAAGLMVFFYRVVSSTLIDYAQSGRLNDEFLVEGEVDGRFQALTGALSNAAMTSVMVVLFIAVIYAPFSILIANLFERRASFSLVIREEYAPVVSCTLLSLTAALIVALPAAIIIGRQTVTLKGPVIGYLFMLVLMPLPIFAALMTITIGTTFRIGWAAAAVTTLISFLSILGASLLIPAMNFICASPFLLLMLVFLLRDKIDEFIGSTRSRQSFKQNLQAATLNPADASAHYQLGLIYQKRGELDAADGSFKRAVEIDPGETDAHYQLGRIARQEGRLNEAVQHFEKVVRLEQSHSQNEIWR
jgi:Tetratricopeptide repeat